MRIQKDLQTMIENNIEQYMKTIPAKSDLDALSAIAEPFQELMAYYRCAIMEVETKFRVLDIQLSIQNENNPIETIKTRLKRPESILAKLQRRGHPLTIESIEKNLFDIAGVRVICSFPEDIYRVADCLLRQDDIRLIERKDYIKHPKDNGYRSLHLIIEVPIFLQTEKRMMKVEVQLRTIAMDFWASLEHKLRYKKNMDAVEDYALVSQRLKACAELSANLDTQMEAIRNQIINVPK